MQGVAGTLVMSPDPVRLVRVIATGVVAHEQLGRDVDVQTKHALPYRCRLGWKMCVNHTCDEGGAVTEQVTQRLGIKRVSRAENLNFDGLGQVLAAGRLECAPGVLAARD